MQSQQQWMVIGIICASLVQIFMAVETFPIAHRITSLPGNQKSTSQFPTKATEITMSTTFFTPTVLSPGVSLLTCTNNFSQVIPPDEPIQFGWRGSIVKLAGN